MKKTIQFTALCAGITLASITGANASNLSEAAALMLFEETPAKANAVAIQFNDGGGLLEQTETLATTIVTNPSGDISDDVTTVKGKIGLANLSIEADVDDVIGKIGGIGAVLDTNIDAVKAKVLIAPTLVLDTDVNTMRTRLGTAAQFVTMRGVVNGLTPNGGAINDFVNGTTGTAVPVDLPTLNGVNGSIENYDRTLRRIAFNILSTGVVGNQNGIVTNGGSTENTVTWCQIIEALATIADHA